MSSPEIHAASSVEGSRSLGVMLPFQDASVNKSNGLRAVNMRYQGRAPKAMQHHAVLYSTRDASVSESHRGAENPFHKFDLHASWFPNPMEYSSSGYKSV